MGVLSGKHGNGKSVINADVEGKILYQWVMFALLCLIHGGYVLGNAFSHNPQFANKEYEYAGYCR